MKSFSSTSITIFILLLCIVGGVSVVLIRNQRSIQQQLQATQAQLSTMTSSTDAELSQQAQQIDLKTSQITKLEQSVQASTNSDNSSNGGMSGILASLAPSVVKIICDSDSSGQNLQEGSGVLYYSNSSSFGPYYVETNLHVVQTSDNSPSACVFAIYPDYTSSSYLIYDTSGYSVYQQGVDVAFLTPQLDNGSNAGTMGDLKMYAKNLTSHTYCSSSSIGDHVSILGYPGVGGASLTATDGIISGFEFDSGVRFIKTSAEIEHGNSGGVAIEDSGCILGIPTFVDQGEISSIGRILDLNYLFQ